ncbi:hypothetical protein JQX09_24680 [Sulfitobacter pseudonitzschiae]|uniref:Uncharacterized protein n=1 Tax=Pseudosulfitobacter pseudonitzschiae TaxID=1402135 RepID=A0A9Q2NSQ0_9RHOB|nr:hypothetical protein [Pseudosulfitobacter pseudonitzschiae]MBM2295109.1 hypothetical protein [Pseudosulfitobacter pseudonitzschiae]MBM2299330.1 hypothetical protein [Pseudosulfitobacter pseudonitzschiae]MBM2304943.1 hypothetical protein [Pseudosulfitobacter pseudonitzschiae]MBM2314720.1 hypothetical protein [Pseudosulfitobacter pseudonitzschiae]MBM2319628.1 hypothetical protein [Pseudosulfitobacter pseudonitzschiae]
MYIDKKLVIEGFGEMIQERVAAGWMPYLLTFMFNPLGGSQKHQVAQMMDEVGRTYHKILTRMHRNPKNVPSHLKPLWIASPDFPVHKHMKDSFQSIAVNNGLHFHAVALISPENRLGRPFDTFINEKPKRFAGRDRYLRALHVVEISQDADYVAEYVLKSVKNGRANFDDLLVLPYASSERPSSTKWERRKIKKDGEKRRL